MVSIEREYLLDFWKRGGFRRVKCSSCGMPFWTTDPARTLCGDPPCVEYSFIHSPLTRKPYSLSEMRESFLEFFEKRGHTRIGRYPVVARWRDDIYLTIASIAVFQPHVTTGVVPPPANPLCISQPCIRLNDIDSVGKSGRHLTTFEMMAHHAFNSPTVEVYFKDRTVELCHEFLTSSLGIEESSITYKENPWAGGGNAGPALEVLSGGLEVATLVFMNMVRDDSGPIELHGERYREMPQRIVDTGYGLERLVWASQGTPTIYDAIFPEVVQRLAEEASIDHRLHDPHHHALLSEMARLSALVSVETGTRVEELRRRVHERLRERGHTLTYEELVGVLEPLGRVYAIADHTRALAFMLGDGIVPSNVKAGYLARLVLRRALRAAQELGLETPLREIVDLQFQLLGRDHPELLSLRSTALLMVDLEVEKFEETLERGRRIVEREARGGTLGTERLVELYDSWGMPPDIVRSVAWERGIEIEVPDNFYSLVARRHSFESPGSSSYDSVRRGGEKLAHLPPTRLLYYEAQETKEFEAVVLYSKDRDVVLDRTAFYPEGGGQPADRGFLRVEDETYRVVDVQKYAVAGGVVVVHTLEEKAPKRGAVVQGRVDWGRRTSLTRHHTATHVVLGACRRVLGNHVWQGGAQKGTDRSRIDITHFRRLTEEEIREIEQLANVVVLEDLPVERSWLPREDAERRYGVQLYQGGVPEGRMVRVVRIADFDVEACAGTHVRSTSEIGAIKILRVERVQDGLERIEFAAGLSAIRHVEEMESLLRKTASRLSVPLEEVPKAAGKFFDEWKALRNRIEALEKEVAHFRVQALLERAQKRGDVRIVVEEIDRPLGEVRALASRLTEEPHVVAILGTRVEGARVVVARSADLSWVHAGKVAQSAGRILGGGGGGRAESAEAGGSDPSKIPEALLEARKALESLLG